MAGRPQRYCIAARRHCVWNSIVCVIAVDPVAEALEHRLITRQAETHGLFDCLNQTLREMLPT